MATMIEKVGEFVMLKGFGDGYSAYADNPMWCRLRAERDARAAIVLTEDAASIAGFPVVIDRSVPANELHFRHGDGRKDVLVFDAALAEG